ncbi:MAG TPA: MarR family transcriptional regulator [Gemmatimonadaceae bacterium]|nr:MarR family transcriptional regulator [Gemmatimonadaceae bacterium]
MFSAVASIRRIVRVLRLASRQTQAAAGISAAQLFVLQQLGEGAELSLNDLAERTLTDRSSVAAVVERLQVQQLVDRTTDPSDRRRAVVRITASGRRILGRAPDAPTTALLAALRRLDRRALTALARSLGQLTVALGATEEPPSMLFADDGTVRASRPRKPTRSPSRRSSRTHE